MTTSNEIETPSFGGKMRASWGAAVTRAVNAHEAELQELRRPVEWRSARAEAWTAPVPFEVRRLWVSESGGAGKVAKWCIYLPANCLHVGTDAVDATTGLAAPDGAPAGWYELPEAPEEAEGDMTAYLHVTLPYAESSGSGTVVEHDAEAEVVAEAEKPGEHDMYVEVASVHSGGAEDSVEQKVVGTLVIMDGSARQPAGELPAIDVVTGATFAFDPNTGQLVATLSMTNLKTNAVSTAPVVLPLWKQDVDSGSAYSTSNHKYTKVVMPSVRTVDPAPGASSSDVTTVFVSTPLSAAE